MPIIRIELLEGRTIAVKANLITQVTEATVRTLGVDPEQVRVLLYELPPQHWAIGGQTKAAQASTPEQRQEETE